MHPIDPNRRNLLLGIGGLGVYHMLKDSMPLHAAETQRGYVLDPSQGEHLIHFRDRGNIFIKASAATGSNNFAMGTQQVMTGTGIPVHRHPVMDEGFTILKGSGTVTLDDVARPFEPGTSIFIPRNTWHSFANPDHELLVLWIVSPGGLENFFRETCSTPGAPPRQLTRDQIRQIALKYGTEFK